MLWTTDLRGKCFPPASVGEPKRTLHKILNMWDVKQGAEKTRVWTWWQRFKKFFKISHSRKDLKEHLQEMHNTIGFLQQHIHAVTYKQASRTRWACTLRTLAKVAAGTLALIVYGRQGICYQTLLMAPECLHTAAALQQNPAEHS